MKSILRAIKKMAVEVGGNIAATWRLLAYRAAVLYRLLRLKLYAAAAPAWRRHRRRVAWLAVWLLSGTLATAGLGLLYTTHPDTRSRLDRLAATLTGAARRLFNRRPRPAAGWAAARRVTPLPARPVTPRRPQTARPIPGLPPRPAAAAN